MNNIQLPNMTSHFLMVATVMVVMVVVVVMLIMVVLVNMVVMVVRTGQDGTGQNSGGCARAWHSRHLQNDC